MRKDEIVVGGTYSDAKGGVRRVIGMGSEFRSYSGQVNADCVGYAVVQGRAHGGNHGKTPEGEIIGHCTRAGFAAWAKKRVAADHCWPAKAVSEREAMIEALREAERQIEYLHEKFQSTGTGEAVLARIRSVLATAA